MAKLSLSVSGNNDQVQSGTNNSATSKLSLTKKVNNGQIENSTEGSSMSLSKKVENQTSDPVADSNRIASWLVSTFGGDVFEELINNPNLQLPYADEDLSAEQWLERTVKTLFSVDSVAKISSRIPQNSSVEPPEDEIEKIVKERMNEKIEKYNVRFQQMRSEMETLEGEKAAVSAQLNKAIPLGKFVTEIFKKSDENVTQAQKRISQTIEEALETSKDENLSTFVIRFAKGWIALKAQIENFKENAEKENLELIYPVLTNMLTLISGCYISERRTILEFVAQHCNEYFSDYVFISPEQTLNVDPEIHNASGAGNGNIKEGSSFAVVRSDTKKTVKYADIKL